MAISDGDIASAAASAGLSGSAVAIAVAVAIAESGGNPKAHNPVPPDNSYGLWQINMLAHTHKELGISKNEDLYDPATNARAMAIISNSGKNWKPWTTYTRGTYLLFKKRGEAVAGTAAGSATDVSASVPSNVSELADKLADGHFWARIGEYVVGFLLIAVGLVLIGVTGKVKNIASAAGAVAKVVK